MADNAILASLLMGQRRRRDPFELQRQYGQSLMQQGASTAPLQSGSPLEGIARALTAGVGGYFSGKADRDADARDQKTMTAIGDLLSAPTAEARNAKLAALKDSGADMEVLAPFMAQILGQRMEDERKTAMGQRAYGAAGGVLPGGSGGSAPVQLAPQGVPQPGYDATVAPGQFANNTGNIRASNIPWDGKGAPHNGFETFATPQQGVNAHFKNFEAYAKANPQMTVAQAIAKWSPPNENDTQGVIRQIAEASGINPGMPLAEVLADPMVASRLLDAQTRLEKGGMPQGVTADTFIAAAGGQAAPGMPGPVAQAPAAPAGPQFDPGADYEAMGRRAAEAGDYQTATAYQTKANEARAQFKAEQAKDQTKRAGEGAEWDRRQEAERTAATEKLNQPLPAEMQKLREARAEGTAIINALQDFKREFEKGPGWKSMLGSATPANTAYNNAALLMKGEALYNLGVLNGPDLEIIRRMLPDPGTPGGQFTSVENMRTAVEKITNLINSRISEKEKSMGIAPAGVAPAAPAVPAGSDVVQQARDAIAKGAPREKVIERLKGMGVPTDGL